MRLVQGMGSPEKGACWMSAIAWYAGEQSWTDAPECVCPVLRGLCVWVNDALASDADRERVIAPVMFMVVGSNQPEATKRRLRFVVRWAQQSARKARTADADADADAAANAAANAADAAEHIILPAILRLAPRGEAQEVPQVRDLAELEVGRE